MDYNSYTTFINPNKAFYFRILSKFIFCMDFVVVTSCMLRICFFACWLILHAFLSSENFF